MAFNDIILNDRNNVLSKLFSNIAKSNFKEDKIFLENSIINFDIEEERIKKSLNTNSKIKQLDKNDFLNLKSFIDFKLTKIKDFKESLIDISQEYYNQIEIKKINLNSTNKEIRQKLNILNGFSKTIKFALEENFNNYFYINTNIKDLLNIDTDSNIATLPVEQKDRIRVNSIKINSASNMIPGSPINGKNKLILSVLSNDSNQYFECFKYDSGPGKLILAGEFKKEEVINEVHLSTLAVSGISSLKIEDIVYTDAFNKSISIKKLINENFQSLNISSLEDEELLKIIHLPIKALKYKIILKNNEYQVIKNRKLFRISIKSLAFFKNEFKETGQFKSKEITSPENVYHINGKSTVYPDKSNSYIEELKFSIDEEDSYQNDFFGLNLNGEQKKVVYNYKLKRNLTNLNSKNIIKKDLYLINTKTFLKNYNKNISPINYNINEDKENLLVYIPDVIKRSSNIEHAEKIGAASTKGKNKILLPRGLKNLNISKKEIELFFNNVKWVQLDNLNELTEEGFFYIDDKFEFAEIFLTETNNYFVCKMLLKPKILPIIKQPEGYYLKIKESFDLDNKKIKINSLFKNEKTKEEYIPKGEETFFLEEEYILKNSFKLFVKENGTWIEDEENYELDELKGRVFTFDNLEKERKVNYLFYKNKEVKDFSIWTKENDFFGIFINEESLDVEKIKQKLNDPIEPFFNIDEENQIRAQVASDNTFVLKEAGIIKGSLILPEDLFDNESFIEVEYVNGYTEFLNLKKILEDQVPQIEKDSQGNVTFTLSEIFYEEETIKVFKNNEEIETVVSFSNDKRVCTLKLLNEDTIAENYHLSYYYIDQNENNSDVKKVSVDYEKGILFSSENIIDPSLKEIEYEVNRVLTEYSLIENIEEYEFDENQIKVYTENLPENKKIKFCFYNNIDNFSIEGLEKYYSPLIYNIKIEMS